MHTAPNCHFVDESSESSTVASVGLFHDRGFLLVPNSLVVDHSVLCGLEHEPFQVTIVNSCINIGLKQSHSSKLIHL